MKLGIISDTHDNMPKVWSAVELFNKQKVDAVLHCGDFVAPFSLIPFKELECGKFHAVFGNNDGEKTGIKALAFENGWDIEDQPKVLEFSNRRIVIVHESERIAQLPGLGAYDVILHGHTHRKREERNGDFLILNPGEGGGWVSGNATVAVLDIESLDLEFFPI